jgi:hypothetical protein
MGLLMIISEHIPFKPLKLSDRQLEKIVDSLNENSPSTDEACVQAINAIVDNTLRHGGDFEEARTAADDWLNDVNRWADIAIEYDEDNDEMWFEMLRNCDDED